MDIESLVAALAGRLDESPAAGAALVELGAGAVGPVLAALCDERSPVDWVDSGLVLRKIGEPALLPLVAAKATAATDEIARRVAWALAGLSVDGPGAFAPLLRHPHPSVRHDALYAFQTRAEAAVAFIGDLFPLLADPEPTVRQRAVRTFEAIGAAALPALRRLRDEPAPGPGVRSGALAALATLAGPAGISDRDLAAWRRLTRIKAPDETPEGMHLCGGWYAVPTADQAAVLDAFGLSDPEPVTLRTGAAAWNQARHGTSPAHPHAGCSRVFVSPVLDGWTLVFGDAAKDAHRIGRAADTAKALSTVVNRRCAELSRRFGAAQWYGMSCGDGWTAWCVAEDGEVVRFYDAEAAAHEWEDGSGSGAAALGGAPAHPAEAGFVLPHQEALLNDDMDDDGDEDDEGGDDGGGDGEAGADGRPSTSPETCYANDIAARLSVDPGALGPRTTVTGQGVLALTACGRAHGHPAGALPV